MQLEIDLGQMGFVLGKMINRHSCSSKYWYYYVIIVFYLRTNKRESKEIRNLKGLKGVCNIRMRSDLW